MLTIREGLINAVIVRVYLLLIIIDTVEIVTDLRKTLHDNAKDHPKLAILEEAFVARLGK
jgi:hypothetical protein